MQTKTTNQQNDLNQKQQNTSQQPQQNEQSSSRIFNAGEMNSDQNRQNEKEKTGIDHTLTPGQNPVPPDDQNRSNEWNKNEKVNEDEKMYAANREKNQQTQQLNREEEDDEENEGNPEDAE